MWISSYHKKKKIKFSQVKNHMVHRARKKKRKRKMKKRIVVNNLSMMKKRKKQQSKMKNEKFLPFLILKRVTM